MTARLWLALGCAVAALACGASNPVPLDRDGPVDASAPDVPADVAAVDADADDAGRKPDEAEAPDLERPPEIPDPPEASDAADTSELADLSGETKTDADPDTLGAADDGSGVVECPDATPEELMRQAGLLSGQVVVEVDLSLGADAIQQLRVLPFNYVAAGLTITDPSGVLGPYQVAVRLKGGGDGTGVDGGSFQDIDHKPSFKIDVNRLVPCQAIVGLTKLTFNNMVQDPSMLHEWVAYGVYREQGLPAARVGYAWLRVNGDDYGLYANVEVYDQRGYRHANFPSTSHLYEGQSGADFSTALAWHFEIDHGDPTDRSDLNAAVAAVTSAPLEGLLQATHEHFHWTAVATFLAVERFVGQPDGYTQERNNFYAHSDDDGRMTLLPWGQDLAARDPLLFGYIKGNLVKRCIRDPACNLLYIEALAATVQAAATGQLLQRATAQAALLAPYIAVDPRRPYGLEEQQSEAATTLAFIAMQPTRLQHAVACAADHSLDADKDGYDCIHDCDDELSFVYPGSVPLCP